MTGNLFNDVSTSLMEAHTDQRTAFFLKDPELLAWHLKSRGYRSTTPFENKQRLYALLSLTRTSQSIFVTLTVRLTISCGRRGFECWRWTFKFLSSLMCGETDANSMKNLLPSLLIRSLGARAANCDRLSSHVCEWYLRSSSALPGGDPSTQARPQARRTTGKPCELRWMLNGLSELGVGALARSVGQSVVVARRTTRAGRT
jgi:hypothetical protein